MTQNEQQNKVGSKERLKQFLKRPRKPEMDGADAGNQNWFKRIIHWFSRMAAESISAILTVALIFLISVTNLMNRPDVDLAFFKPHYEQWFSDAFDGRSTNIEKYSARWLQDKRAAEITAKNIEITGQDDARQKIDLVKGEFVFFDGTSEKPSLQALTVDGGALTLLRTKDGIIRLGLGTPQTFEKVAPLWTSNANRTTEGENGDLLRSLKSVTVENATVFVIGEANDFAWELTNIDGRFDFDGSYIRIESAGEIVTPDGNAPFAIEVKTSVDRSDFEGLLDIDQVKPIHVAPQSGPFKIIGNLDALIDLKTAVSFSSEQGVTDLDFEFAAGKGKLKTGKTFKPFDQAEINAAYHADQQNIQITKAMVRSLALNLDAVGGVTNIGDPKSGFGKAPVNFEIDLGKSRLNPGVKFDGPFVVDDGIINGQFDLKNGVFSFDQLDLDFGSFQTAMSAKLVRSKETVFKNIIANGTIEGEMSPEQLLGFWPNVFGLGARNWIKNSIKSATLKNLEFVVAIDETDFQNGRVANDHVNLKFEVEDADVQYMTKLPWLRGASGHGVLQGNRVDFYLTSGSVDELIVEKGAVAIPRLSPKGGDLTIELNGIGDAAEMLRVTNFQPFEFANRFQINPSDFGGQGKVFLKVTRPLLEFFDQDRILYELEGDFTNVSLPVGVGKYTLNNGQLKLGADRNGINVTGPIDMGEWQTDLNWEKPLGEGSGPANFTLIGDIGRDELDSFGIGLRRHFGGNVGVRLSGVGDGVDVQKVRLFSDLFDTELNIGTIWNKQKGEPGSLAGLVNLDPEKGVVLEEIVLKSNGLDLDGSIAIGKDLKLENLDFSTAKIEGFIDAAVQAKPTSDGVLSLFLTGDYLNVEPWVDRAFKTQTSAVTAPIRLTASIKKLSLSENYQLANASALFSHDGTATQQARLKGEAESGALVAEISRDDGSQNRTVHVEVPDAGRALLTLLSIDSIEKGALTIDGKLPPVGTNGGVTGTIKLLDFKLVRAPAFAQILSLASLTGLADTLGGSGLAFAELESKFGLEKGVFKVREARASGPALGLTVEGDVGISSKTLDMDGVLVPSYTANSLLGDIPLIGDIVVGKKGEGVFALNYSIKGPFSSTQVSVNPLSALTPGFLRRIFDVKRDKIEDQTVKELIEEQKQEN